MKQVLPRNWNNSEDIELPPNFGLCCSPAKKDGVITFLQVFYQKKWTYVICVHL